MVADQKGHASRHESGGGDSITHNNLSLSSDDHHSKTSSASELTDVSPDSVSDAHHSKYTDTNARNAVTGSVDAANLTGSSGTNGQVLQTDGSVASWVDFSSGASVSDDGSQILAQPDDVNYATGLDVTDDSDGTVTVDAGGDHQVVDTNKVLQQTIRFGAEGSETTSSSYVTIPDSDLALDFDELKNSNSSVYAKVKYHLFNTSSHGVETSSEAKKVPNDITGMDYSDGLLYTVDYTKNNVVIYSYPELERVDIIDVSANASANICDIAVADGANGNIFLLETDASVITYDSTYTFLNNTDISGNTSSNVKSGITYDSNGFENSSGNVAIYDEPNGSIDIYSTTMNFQSGNSVNSNYSKVMYDKGRNEFYLIGNSDLSSNQGRAIAYDTSFSRVSGSDFDVGGQIGQNNQRIATYVDANKTYFVGNRGASFYEYTAEDGTSDARIYRQNAGTAVSGSEVTGTSSRTWEFLDSGWIDLSSESGTESYQIQLKANGGEATYNSAVLYIATPQ